MRRYEAARAAIEICAAFGCVWMAAAALDLSWNQQLAVAMAASLYKIADWIAWNVDCIGDAQDEAPADETPADGE